MTHQFNKHCRRLGVFAVVLTVLLFLNGLPQAYGQDINPEIFNQLRYRHIGPPGNRTSAVCGEPGNPLVYYIGAASGGIFKSTDGGTTWLPPSDPLQLPHPTTMWYGPEQENPLSGAIFPLETASTNRRMQERHGHIWGSMKQEESGG